MCARSEAGPSRLPVTEEIAGSNPVGRAKVKIPHLCGIFTLACFTKIWTGEAELQLCNRRFGAANEVKKSGQRPFFFANERKRQLAADIRSCVYIT